jgi:RecJ-like exonuclease
MNRPILYCDDGSEVELPYRFAICSSCDGEGKSSAYLGAFTRDDLDEAGAEFCQEYFAGRYDRECGHCDGTGKIAVVDRKRMTSDQRLEWDAQVRAENECAAIERAERAMGA